MVEISDIFDTEYLDDFPEHKEIRRSSMSIDQFGYPNPFRTMDTGLVSYGDGRELNVDLDAFREMLLQNKRYNTPVQVNEGEFLPPGWVHPAMIGNQEMDIDQLGLASFDLWRDLDANIWNASRKGLEKEGFFGQYDDRTHDIFLNVDANRDMYDYSFPNEDWGKYGVVSHETAHPFTGPNPAKHLEEGTWVDINEINPLLNLDWYDQDDPAIWSDPTKNPHQDPTLIQPYRSAYDRMHDYLAWNANNYAGFSGYPERSKTDEFGRVRKTGGGPFVPHHNWKPTALDVTRMAELNDLARSWNEGTWQPINTRKESYISGNDPQKIGNMPTLEKDWRVPYTVERFAGNPHKDLINEFRRPKKTPQPKGTERFSTGGLVSLVL